EQKIYTKLQSKFTPSQLLVQDVSGGCGDFYAITIASDAFNGLSTLKQHRLVQDELKEEIESIHGLQV
ncbi:bola-like protein, partial [Ramaria rubella]